MDIDTSPTLRVGRIALAINGQSLVITHQGKAGLVRLAVDPLRLERWALRLMRDEVFQPGTCDDRAAASWATRS